MRNDGGSAFPDSGAHEPRSWEPSSGMTLRDYFAAAALSGNSATFGGLDRHQIAAKCYQQADAMLAERER